MSARRLVQLFVPLFMLMLMLFIFACVMFEIEWDYEVAQCAERWLAHGVSRTFLEARADGVDWDCSVCSAAVLLNASACVQGTAAADSADSGSTLKTIRLATKLQIATNRRPDGREAAANGSAAPAATSKVAPADGAACDGLPKACG